MAALAQLAQLLIANCAAFLTRAHLDMYLRLSNNDLANVSQVVTQDSPTVHNPIMIGTPRTKQCFPIYDGTLVRLDAG